MRRVRAIAVVMAVMMALLGTLVTNANATVGGGKAKGSAANAYGDLAFHGSGFLSKVGGGYEVYGSPVGYFSGKAECYVQDGTTTGAFLGLITKADSLQLVGTRVLVWIVDGPTDKFSVAFNQPRTCDPGIIVPTQPVLPNTEPGGYIDLR